MFDNYFFNNVIKKNHIKFPKEWHKDIKKVSNYQINKGLLDLTRGPIADINDFRLAMKGNRIWEEVRIYRECKKIAQIQEQ